MIIFQYYIVCNAMFNLTCWCILYITNSLFPNINIHSYLYIYSVSNFILLTIINSKIIYRVLDEEVEVKLPHSLIIREIITIILRYDSHDYILLISYCIINTSFKRPNKDNVTLPHDYITLYESIFFYIFLYSNRYQQRIKFGNMKRQDSCEMYSTL